MINIPGYAITQIVYEDSYLLVAFALSEHSASQVLLKIVKSGKNTTIENAKLIHEFNFLRELEMEGLFKPNSYMNFKNMMILEYEPIHALTLRDYWSEAVMTPAMYVQILKRVVMRLHELHKRNILHLNIRPDTLLIRQHSLEIFLTGFGYAIHLNEREDHEQSSLEGNPVYMSPEQTGRMNFSVDARADIYSLGMTFYELFANRLPFTATGALAWAHAHIAKTPPPLSGMNPALPPFISDMVMKMLVKDPERRYPSMEAMLEQLDNYSRNASIDSSIDLAKANDPAVASNRPDLPKNMHHAALASLSSDGTSLMQAHRTSLIINDNIVSYPQVLDLAAIVQASQIFSEALNGEQIAARLMQLIVTNTGAQRGLLLLPYSQGWYVDIEIRLENGSITFVLPHRPLEAYLNVQQEMIARALRDKVIMQGIRVLDASEPSAFYSGYRKGGSALCMPIFVHDQPQGLLYIENLLTAKHFAPERFPVIRNLVSQALFAMKSRQASITIEASSFPKELAAGLGDHAEIRHSLTNREQEVLKLLAMGLSNKEIAASLMITSETVKTHLKNIFEKLKVDRRMKAAAIAKTIGLLDDGDP